ncbi:unnamed protein product [Rotaria magnacalcarata]|uniref:SCP domain-containing protein n=1 Tax=Rotaria magnacalcarata TaxID=392030 RepID=A0A816WD92_9BILA|nr:unnamed protein product [Rotaria magnacalcarata]CAF2135754.1 unnamed protein product [Rotaria magnacalcarata]
MKRQLLRIIFLTFFVFSNAELLNHNKDSVEQSSIHHVAHLSLTRKEISRFTPAHRTFQNDALKIHNILRARHCVSPLVLDEEMNIRAQIYAEHLAEKDGKLIHSTDRNDRFGENLYAITRKTPITNLAAEKVVRTWYDEIQFYDYNKPVYNASTGHFTQIVWRESKILGVGYASARKGAKMFVVAQYGPAGNHRFKFSTNVLKPEC